MRGVRIPVARSALNTSLAYGAIRAPVKHMRCRIAALCKVKVWFPFGSNRKIAHSKIINTIGPNGTDEFETGRDTEIFGVPPPVFCFPL